MTFFAFAYIALIFQSLGPLSKCLKGWLQLRWASNADPEVALKMVACTNTNVYPMGPQPNVPTEQVDAETHDSDKERQSKVDSSVAFEPQVLKDFMFSPALKLAIQGIVSSSVTEALQVFSNHKAQERFSGGLSSHSQLGFPSLTQRLLWAWVFLWKKRLADKIWHGHACTIRRRIAPNSSRKTRRQKFDTKALVPSDVGLPGTAAENSPPSSCLFWLQRALWFSTPCLPFPVQLRSLRFLPGRQECPVQLSWSPSCWKPATGQPKER